MTIFEFSQKFPDEESCRIDLRNLREQQGIICKKCQCIKHYWQSGRCQWQCSNCGFRTTLRSGTIMECSNLKILQWYKAMFLMTVTKKNISANEMKRQLGMKRYEPVWYMMHKIRAAMGNRDDSYNLHGAVEIDEGMFESVKSYSDTKSKRGRGSQRQSKILVMAESEMVSGTKKYKYAKTRACGFFKMKKIQSFQADEITSLVADFIDPNASIISDGFKAYNKLLSVVNKHQPVVKQPSQTVKLLPWVHIAIANSKRSLLSTYHHVSYQYIQNYLNEFAYKLNRRNFGTNIFNRLLVAAVAAIWY